MSNNNHKHPSCEFAEQMISYLYGENETGEFEAHLKSCSDCADELAGFGFARRSIVEWRDEDFLNLQTPVIEIPTSETKKPFVSANSRSWLAELRRVFNFNLAFAASALAALVVCGGLVWIALNFSKNNVDVARIDNKNVAKTVASSTVEPINEQSADNKTDKNPSNKSLKPSNAPPDIVNPVAPKDVAVKISNNPPKNISGNSETVVNADSTNKKNKKSPAVKKSQTPTLTNAEEEEDDSVRLADLFAEIDSK